MRIAHRSDYAPDIRRGTVVTLVHHYPTPDGWDWETITGTYLGRDSQTWHLDDRHLPRDDWEICTP